MNEEEDERSSCGVQTREKVPSIAYFISEWDSPLLTNFSIPYVLKSPLLRLY